tara:strand:- start:4704 stop:4979 length:276 start_codon:yes stop_codon:yes gene_type:complete
MMIADIRGDNLDRNSQKDPHHSPRCEMCWKPLYGVIKHVFVTCPDNLILPAHDGEISAESDTVSIGPACYRRLRKLGKEYKFVVKTKKEKT